VFQSDGDLAEATFSRLIVMRRVPGKELLRSRAETMLDFCTQFDCGLSGCGAGAVLAGGVAGVPAGGGVPEGAEVSGFTGADCGGVGIVPAGGGVPGVGGCGIMRIWPFGPPIPGWP